MARTNREVLSALRSKRGGVSPQAVQQRRARLQRLVPMPADIATYILAHREGVPIERYLDRETLHEVATFDERLAAKEAPRLAPPPSWPPRKRRTAARIPDVSIPAGVLTERHSREAERMARDVYPLLYVFENSVREFIDGHLTAAFGPDWWDDGQLVSHDVRRGVEISRRAQAENRTHSRAHARPIYYTTFEDLVRIVRSTKGTQVFKRPLFPRATWFPELVEASVQSRNIVAHMNPLSTHDVRRLKVDFEDWVKQIAGHMPPSIPE